MKVLANTVKEELPAVVLVVNQTFGFDSRADSSHDTIDILSWEEICNLTGRKQVINEHKEALIGDLTFSEEEHDTLILLA